jgi:hypothetical protein
MRVTLLRERKTTILFLLFILTPLVTGLMRFGTADESIERRRFAAWPSIPRSLEEGVQWPERINAYVQDHFGMKQYLLFLPPLTYYVGGERIESGAIIGKEKWLFTASYDAIPKHLGTMCFTTQEQMVCPQIVNRNKAGPQPPDL